MAFGARFFCVASLVSLALFISTASSYQVFLETNSTTFTIQPKPHMVHAIAFPYTFTKNLTNVAVYAANHIVSLEAASYPLNLTLFSSVARSNVNQTVWQSVASNETIVSVTSAHSANESIQAFLFSPCLSQPLLQSSWDLLTTFLEYNSTEEVTLSINALSLLVDTSVAEKEAIEVSTKGITPGGATQPWEHYFSFSGKDEYSFHVNLTGKEPVGKYFANVTVGCGAGKREFPIAETESRVSVDFEVKGWKGPAIITLTERFPEVSSSATFVFQVTGYASEGSRFWNWNAWQIAVVVAVPILLIVIVASVVALLCCRIRRHSEYEPL